MVCLGADKNLQRRISDFLRRHQLYIFEMFENY